VPLDGGVNACTKFKGTTPLKFGKAKNVQNLARFRTTFDFDHKYLQNRLRYRQAVNGVINYRFFRVEQKRSGELWSINHKVLFAHFDPPNIDSVRVFGRPYFGP